MPEKETIREAFLGSGSAKGAWASGSADREWHCIARDDWGVLECCCGHFLLGPVHLRRAQPQAGTYGRAVCAASEARANPWFDSSTDGFFVDTLAFWEARATAEFPLWPDIDPDAHHEPHDWSRDALAARRGTPQTDSAAEMPRAA
ncbi:hypothetical protein AB8O55_11840 [Saccharopolyspora cebuensis]|uniref:Uncharacterized protein n=1 Tax=Saccharopolyspora cebuensis TaxID=418759 RepID=A0ABV4CHX1_9PSEU